MNTSIAVHGGAGVVGGALTKFFLDQEYEVRVYDPPQNKLDSVSDIDIHFLAVPTPFSKDSQKFDDTYIRQSCEYIKSQRQDKPTTIIIKSTVVPGTSKSLQDKYPSYSILFSPEFLRARTAHDNTINPERQIVGWTKEVQKEECQRILRLLPKASYEAILPATEAELIKYFSNAFLASKVIYANMIYNICEKLEADYNIVKKAAK